MRTSHFMGPPVPISGNPPLDGGQLNGTKLLPEELVWADRFEFLQSRGYLLRPRYRPGWVASWTLNPKVWQPVAEDSFGILHEATLDAERISDGKTVVLKHVPKSSPEAEIGWYLSSEPLKSDPRNHSVPLLDVLEDGNGREKVILVFPILRRVDMPPPASVRELADLVEQTLEGLLSEREGTPMKNDTPSRTAVGGVRYYFIDFGISTRDQDLTVGLDGQERAPELSIDQPYDPYKLDVYVLGMAYNRLLENTHLCAEFLDSLIEFMTKKEPSKRPSAAEAFDRFQQFTDMNHYVNLSMDAVTALQSQNLLPPSPAYQYLARENRPPEPHLNQQAVSSVTFEDSEIFTDGLAGQITSISARATNVRGRSCDLYTGLHKTEGKVALKRPRIAEDNHDLAIVREAKTWKDLQHPNVLCFLGACKIDSIVYLVSPFMKNGTIMDFIAKHPLKANRIQLIREIASALEYLHTRNIIHGDLKGNNVLISDDVHCLVCDFGLSRMQDVKTSTTMKGAGTVRWQAPEIWENDPKSFKTDVYALAMTIVEVVSGDVPFSQYAENTAVITTVHVRNERPNRELVVSSDQVTDNWLWDIITLCWDKNPRKRPCMSEIYPQLLWVINVMVGRGE
ncbi:hypothetical protein FRB99_002519 [Tulasnella sp. 403]|nr:hypothetical protein FRB99_002519 [Tulasnella sp. 403]